MNFEELTVEAGYMYSEYEVMTRDGYVLTLFRVRAPGIDDDRPVVFLQHGIEDSADCWVMNHADDAPAFVLAEEGYDVWLANSRGSKHSRKHTKLDA